MRSFLLVSALPALVGCAAHASHEATSPPGQHAAQTRSNAAPDPIARSFVDAHNQTRSRLGLPALGWSDELARTAQRAAKTCSGQHSQSSFGENLYGKTEAPRPEEAVAAWVKEGADYDHSRNACRSGRMCGHYTQVVWRSTKLVGCAIQGCGPWTYVYCEYDPPGNWQGERPY